MTVARPRLSQELLSGQEEDLLNRYKKSTSIMLNVSF